DRCQAPRQRRGAGDGGRTEKVGSQQVRQLQVTSKDRLEMSWAVRRSGLNAGIGRRPGQALGGFQPLRLLLKRAGTSLQLGRRRRVVDRLGQASVPLRLGAQSLHTHAAPPGLWEAGMRSLSESDQVSDAFVAAQYE